MREKPVLCLILSVASLLVLLSGYTSAALAQTPESEPGPSGTPADVPADLAESEAPEPTATALLDELVITRTPAPTPTPGAIDEIVEEITEATGLTSTSFLGLAAADWINLGISILFVLLGYLVGTWLIRRILPQIVRRTPTEFDDRFLETFGSDLRWLVVLLTLHFATGRLTFLGAGLKTLLLDIYFVIVLAIGLHIVWRLIDLADGWYHERSVEEGREDELAPVRVLLVRLGRLVAVMVGLIILLGHFGINVTGLAAVLGIGGLAISLAAQDTIADAIAGFIILVDRPFRIGDRIEIQGVGTWGDVVEIGLRTTRIRTRDNRMVIVPNSIIGANQVINYSYPDPRYRIQTHVGIAYGTDIETARRIIIDTVQQVDGVLRDKPVDALYIEMGDSAMIFRVRWWIESYADTRRVIDRVNTALQETLDGAGIDMPYPTEAVNVQVEPEMAERLARAFREPDQ